jgi:DNA polymerase-3 subunit epsilon
MKFLALDFETANYYGDSACALGLAVVENGQIVRSNAYLIKPPYTWFHFTYIHGIKWNDVQHQPTFGEQWPVFLEYFEGVDFVVAHNAGFDKGVLKACCQRYGLEVPDLEFKCTVRLSRSVLGIYPTKLPMVCKQLGIELKHHDALSDTLACAMIMMEIIDTVQRNYQE